MLIRRTLALSPSFVDGCRMAAIGRSRPLGVIEWARTNNGRSITRNRAAILSIPYDIMGVSLRWLWKLPQRRAAVPSSVVSRCKRSDETMESRALMETARPR